MRKTVALIFVALAAFAHADYDKKTLGLMAASELLWTSDAEFNAPLKRYHDMALPHFRRITGANLRAELEPVYRAFSPGSREAAGAAYVMALHGVDVDRNSDRLVVAAQQHGDNQEGSRVWEALPEAFRDIILRHKRLSTFRALLRMPADGAVAEIAEDVIVEVFGANPQLVRRYVVNAKTYDDIMHTLQNAWQEPKEDNSHCRPTVLRGLRKLESSGNAADRALAVRLRRDVRKPL